MNNAFNNGVAYAISMVDVKTLRQADTIILYLQQYLIMIIMAMYGNLFITLP